MVARKFGVLVAEDHGGVREVLEMRLRWRGFEVWLAPDGEVALQVYQQHREVIDVVLLDVDIPVLSGPRTLAVMRTLTPDIAGCLMSGRRRAYSPDDLRRAGAAKFFAKPLTRTESRTSMTPTKSVPGAFEMRGASGRKMIAPTNLRVIGHAFV